MLHLDLRNINFYIINLQEDQENRLFMQGQMQEFGFPYTFVQAINTKPGTVGIALSHLKALRMVDATVPFVILEDDCKFFFDRVSPFLEVPSETDGIYLGHSHFGLREKAHEGVRWGESKATKYQIYDDHYLKIEAMLARHAILFLTERFRQAAIAANIRALTNFNYHYPGDLAYAQIQPQHLILSPHQPWCYQSEIFGGNWMATKNSIINLPEVKPSSANP